MATTKNITMKQFNGTDYDTLYPKTDVKQIENLTPSSIGAVSKSGDTMTGDLITGLSDGIYGRIGSFYNISDNTNAQFMDTYNPANNSGIRLQVWANKDDPNIAAGADLWIYLNGAFNHLGNLLFTGNAQSLGFPKIAIGSYTGTGTYGANSPNTLNLGVVPKLVLIMSTTETKFTTGAEGGYANYGIFDPNITQMGAVRGSIHVSFSGTTLSWYADVNSNYYPETQQLNKSGVVYKWYVLY